VLRARTRDTNGAEVGTFTANTRPTDAQVTELIAQSVSDVSSAVGPDIDAALWGDASYVAALGAALQVELSYFPEQIGTGRSPYEQLKELYDERLKRLEAAVEAAGGVTPSAGPLPSYGFPMDGDRYIIGRRTAW
jgi:hypothetical protein